VVTGGCDSTCPETRATVIILAIYVISAYQGESSKKQISRTSATRRLVVTLLNRLWRP